MTSLKSNQISDVFNETFKHSDNTLIFGGQDEPLYVPASYPIKSDNSVINSITEPFCCSHDYHRIFYKYDYPRSALHEISHWLIASERRRLLLDFGYWYNPDGRTNKQQTKFMQVEVYPQALEKIFCERCGLNFIPSLDNLSGSQGKNELSVFSAMIDNKISKIYQHPILGRTERFLEALNHYTKKLMLLDVTSLATHEICNLKISTTKERY